MAVRLQQLLAGAVLGQSLVWQSLEELLLLHRTMEEPLRDGPSDWPSLLWASEKEHSVNRNPPADTAWPSSDPFLQKKSVRYEVQVSDRNE